MNSHGEVSRKLSGWVNGSRRTSVSCREGEAAARLVEPAFLRRVRAALGTSTSAAPGRARGTSAGSKRARPADPSTGNDGVRLQNVATDEAFLLSGGMLTVGCAIQLGNRCTCHCLCRPPHESCKMGTYGVGLKGLSIKDLKYVHRYSLDHLEGEASLRAPPPDQSVQNSPRSLYRLPLSWQPWLRSPLQTSSTWRTSQTQSAVRCTLRIQYVGDQERSAQSLGEARMQFRGRAARRVATQLRRLASLLQRRVELLPQRVLSPAPHSRESLSALCACP